LSALQLHNQSTELKHSPKALFYRATGERCGTQLYAKATQRFELETASITTIDAKEGRNDGKAEQYN
jgi:hypothetical protein